MNTADDLLRRALEAWEGDIEKLHSAFNEIRAYLDAPERKDEPVYLARRKGLDDFFTCSKDRYEELSALDLFETKLAYLHPPTNTAPMKPMTEEEILELYNQCEEETSVHSTVFHFDKFAKAIEARGKVSQPLSKVEIEKAFVDSGYLTGDSRQTCFIEGVRFAERHHGIINVRD